MIAACCSRSLTRSLRRYATAAAHDVAPESIGTPARLAERRALYEDKYANALKRKAKESGSEDWRSLAKAKQVKKTASPAQPVASTSKKPAASPIKRSEQASLSSIIDVERIRSQNLDASAIGQLWTGYHATKTPHLSAAIPARIYERVQANARRYPEFVLPLARGDGTEMWLLQWAATPVGLRTLFTPLAVFQAHGTYAPPALALTHYDELAKERGIVLMRGERQSGEGSAGLSDADAQILVVRAQRFYNAGDGTPHQALLQAFHSNPDKFDLEKLIELSTAEIK